METPTGIKIGTGNYYNIQTSKKKIIKTHIGAF